MFDHVLGQAPAIETLLQALSRGRVHHAYRFEGPEGVGKELTALAFARALLCPAGGCDNCAVCHRVLTFGTDAPHVPLHPDCVLVGRQLYPTNLVSAREATGISVEQIRRVVLSRAGYAPHEGRALVFIVRNAEELTVSAANALLKTLEEPGKSTHFVLLTSQPHRLLDTVLSRTLALRFRALSEDAISQILRAHDKPERFAPLAQGSARRALALAESDEFEAFDAFARGIENAVNASTISDSLAFASALPRDRHRLRERLLAYGFSLSEQLQACVHTEPLQAKRVSQRYAALDAALESLDRNTSPTLAVEAMLIQMRETRALG